MPQSSDIGFSNSSASPSHLAHNYALNKSGDKKATPPKDDDWFAFDAEADLENLRQDMQRIADEPSNIGLGVGRALKTFFNYCYGAIAAINIPVFPPLVGASSTSDAGAANSAKMPFDDFFNKHVNNKIKTTLNGSPATKKTASAAKRNFKKICKLAIDNGDEQLVRYFLEHVDRINIELGSTNNIKKAAIAAYNLKSNHLEFYANSRSIKDFVSVFLHEATHFVQAATRSSYSQDFMDSCYKIIGSLSEEVEDSVANGKDISRFKKYAKKSEYRGNYLTRNPNMIDGGTYRDEDDKGGLKNFLFKMTGLGDSFYKTKLQAIYDKEGKSRPVNKEEELLFDFFYNIQRYYHNYKVLRNGDANHYLDEHLNMIFQEREAYLISATPYSIIKEECSTPEIEWLNHELASFYESTRERKVVTEDAKYYLEKVMGIKCLSPKVIPSYPGRVFDPHAKNKLLVPSSLDIERPQAIDPSPKPSSHTKLGKGDSRSKQRGDEL